MARRFVALLVVATALILNGCSSSQPLGRAFLDFDFNTPGVCPVLAVLGQQSFPHAQAIDKSAYATLFLPENDFTPAYYRIFVVPKHATTVTAVPLDPGVYELWWNDGATAADCRTPAIELNRSGVQASCPFTARIVDHIRRSDDVTSCIG